MKPGAVVGKREGGKGIALRIQGLIPTWVSAVLDELICFWIRGREKGTVKEAKR